MDTKYWIIIDGLRQGPYTLDEIRAMDLGGSTPVWREGLVNWIAISELEEMSDRYRRAVPPVPPPPQVYPESAYRQYAHGHQPTERPPMPATYLVWNILALLFCCLIPAVVGLVYSSKVSSRYSSGDYEGSLRASDRACTWLMIAIVCGLVMLPFQLIMMLL